MRIELTNLCDEWYERDVRRLLVFFEAMSPPVVTDPDFNISVIPDEFAQLEGVVEQKGNDILEDSVNIAHRIQDVAEPGKVCVWRQVFDQVLDKLDNHISEVGQRRAGNIDMLPDVFSVDLPWEKLEATRPDTDW